MAFSNLSENQVVTEADASTSDFILLQGQSHGTTNLCMTKQAATTKYDLLASNLTPYANNQLIPRSVWQPNGDYRFTYEEVKNIGATTPPYGRAGIHVTTDGTMLFTYHYLDNTVRKYLFTTPFDLSTLTYSQSTTSSLITNWGYGQVSARSGLMNSSGTRLYGVRGFDSDFHMYEHVLGTPYDLSTLNYVPINKIRFSGVTNQHSISLPSFSQDGKYFVMSIRNASIEPFDVIVRGFLLNTSWDISTINNLAGESSFTVSGNSSATYSKYIAAGKADRSFNGLGSICSMAAQPNNRYTFTFNRLFSQIESFSSPNVQNVGSVEDFDMPNKNNVFSLDDSNNIRRYTLITDVTSSNLSTMVVGVADTRNGYFSGGTLGSLTPTSASVAEFGAVIFNLTFDTNTMRLSFSINASSNTIPPNNWISLSFNGYKWHRTSFTVPYNDGAYWQYGLYLSYNPIPTTSGSSVPVELSSVAYAEDTIPPSAPTSVTATNVTTDSINITWNASTDNVGVAAHRVYMNEILVYTSNNLETSYYTNTVLTPGTSYSFTVYGVDGKGNVSLPSNTLSVSTRSGADSIAPTIPQNINSSLNNTTPRITVTWDASSDNVAVTGYQLWRSVDGSPSALYIATAGLSYSDSAVDFGSTYEYKVRAYDATPNYSGFSSTTSKSPFQSCFVEGTLITLSDGSVTTIERLINGQLLLSSQIETLEDTNNVKELYLWSSSELIESRISSPISKIMKEYANETIIINSGLLEATGSHSQLAKRNGIWSFMPISKIVLGDYLYGISGIEVEVTSVKINKEPRVIYPMSLSPSHTYFANGILTHNIK
jgi:chitodextrinase